MHEKEREQRQRKRRPPSPSDTTIRDQPASPLAWTIRLAGKGTDTAFLLCPRISMVQVPLPPPPPPPERRRGKPAWIGQGKEAKAGQMSVPAQVKLRYDGDELPLIDYFSIDASALALPCLVQEEAQVGGQPPGMPQAEVHQEQVIGGYAAS